MNTQIANPFLFDQLEVRTAVGPDGEVWFCAKDVYTALCIEWSGRAGSLKETPENWQVVLYLQTTHGVKDAVFLAEPAVYQTTFRSRKPEAKRFTMELDGCRRIEHEEWEIMVLQKELEEKKGLSEKAGAA